MNMNFQQTVKARFPNTISESDFVRNSQVALSTYEFDAENSIACVSVCRDEITGTLVDRIKKIWGETFNFSSLGGMVFLGKTGLSAAHHHAPVKDGRERYIYFVMAHIAIDKNGEIGVCYRSGRPSPSGACGALIAFREEMLGGDLNLELDWDDIEQSLLKHRLFRKIRYGDIPDLITLTKATYEVILEDLEHLIDKTVDITMSDYAILSGIQIHGSDKEQYIWPGQMYVVKDGQRHEIKLVD